jgi:predicted ATP-grasp superfamily ATP-dependent carboligase
MRVLVTDADNRAALAIVRSLGRAGHEVLVGHWKSPSMAQSSRYCREAVQYPNPVTDPGGFVEAVSTVVRRRACDMVMPASDVTTALLTEHRDRLTCALPCPDAAVVRRAADKVDVTLTAERIGVPVPRSVVVEHGAPLPPLAGLGYPIVIKPRRSRTLTDAGWASSGVSFAATHDDLVRDLAARPAYEFPLLLQERLVGPGMGVFACYAGGRPIALFSHRRLRERPPWGGVSVLAESVAVDADAGRFATRLLDEIGWDGVAMVEFKRDERDGVPKLMEINGRFWGSLQLAIDAGVDFPVLLATPPAAPPAVLDAYEVGVRERWFWGDVDALLVTLVGGRGTPAHFRASKGRALLDFLTMTGPRLHYDNPKWDDPGPFATESLAWVRQFT